jgi:hypothetical protein
VHATVNAAVGGCNEPKVLQLRRLQVGDERKAKQSLATRQISSSLALHS